MQFFLAHHSDEHILTDISYGKVFILYVDGDPVGTVTISENNINRLFVLPKYRHQGLGRALLDFAEKKIHAVKMYRNVGFQTVDENAEEYIMVCEL